MLTKLKSGPLQAVRWSTEQASCSISRCLREVTVWPVGRRLVEYTSVGLERWWHFASLTWQHVPDWDRSYRCWNHALGCELLSAWFPHWQEGMTWHVMVASRPRFPTSIVLTAWHEHNIIHHDVFQGYAVLFKSISRRIMLLFSDWIYSVFDSVGLWKNNWQRVPSYFWLLYPPHGRPSVDTLKDWHMETLLAFMNFHALPAV